MKRLVQFPLEDGNTVLIEVNEPDTGGITRAARSDEVIQRAARTFDDALEQVKPAAEAVLKKLTTLSTRPDEVEIEFGLKIGAEVGAFIASGTVEANYTVRLKWTGKHD